MTAAIALVDWLIVIEKSPSLWHSGGVYKFFRKGFMLGFLKNRSFPVAVGLAALLFAAGCHRQQDEVHAQPMVPHQPIYSDTANAQADIQNALAKAASEKKRVILDFGGNWCGDCQVLNIYFHQAPNDAILNANFVLVDVNIGHYDMNTDIADKYGVPLKKGVPALAVLDASGNVLYSQRDSEFANMRGMDPNSVTEFLNQWKPNS
jgi:thioredoxin 1